MTEENSRPALTWGCSLDELSFERQQSGGSVWALNLSHLRLFGGRPSSNKIPIMGVSGSGKTTLMNLMAAMEWPDGKGSRVSWCFPDGWSVSWGRRGPQRAESRKLRQRYFGFAFQDSSLIPHLTIGENLSFPLELQGMSARASREKSATYIGKVLKGTASCATLDKYPNELSGGELQRAALVQAMVHDPSVLFADEPTGSLDAATREIVMSVLSDWVDEKPSERMLIWITHHRRDPQALNADRRVFLDAGSAHWQQLAQETDEWRSHEPDR